MNFTKPDQKRQKIVTILLVLVGIILLWQLYELFASSNTAPKISAGKAAVHMSTAVSTPYHQPGLTVTPAATAGQLAQNAVAPGDDTSATVNPDGTQSEYLRLVSEYQMAQLQRMIAEDNEAIAIARQNAAKATSETSKLMGTGNFVAPANNMQSNSNDYQLVYTGQLGDGSWSATLKKNGQNIDAAVGGQLPDGSRVLSIDDNGVLLQRGDVKKLVTFSGVTETTAASGGDDKPTAMQTVQTMLAVEHLPKLAAAEHDERQPVASVPAASVKEQPVKTEAALTATPDVSATPNKKTVAETIKLQAIPLVKNPVEKKVAAEKTEKSLIATPDNPTTPEKKNVAIASKVIADTAKEKEQIILLTKPAAKNIEKPVKYNTLPKFDKPVETVQPAVINVINEPMPAQEKKARALLPLEQPMVSFPRAKEGAAQKQPEAVKAAEIKPVVKPAEIKKPAVTPAIATIKPAPVAAAPVTGKANEQVLAVNPSYYTIQLTSDRELSNLQQFISQYSLQDKAIYFRTLDMKNHQIYILIYGQYTNSADAKAALAKLPQDVKAEGAFIVKFSTIQTVLKKSVPPNK